jgi:flagellar biosynthesis GTPase FlhF
MKITKLNYELYIIDYLEGTLDASVRTEFDSFMNQHPEVKLEIESYLEAPVMIEDEKVIMENKHTLKKGVTKSRVGWITALLLLPLACGIFYFGFMQGRESGHQVQVHVQVQTQEQVQEQVQDIVQTEEQEQDQYQTEIKKEVQGQIVDQIQKTDQPKEPSKKLVQEKEQKMEREQKINFENKQPRNIGQEPIKVEPLFYKENKRERNYVEPKRKTIDQGENDRTMASFDIITKKNYLLDVPVGVRNESLAAVSTEVVVTEKIIETKKKGVNWKNIFTPSAYRNLDVEKALVSQDLQTAAEGLGDAIKPTLITK